MVEPPEQPPIERLLSLAEDHAKLLWRAYHLHLTQKLDTPEWNERTLQIYEEATAADARVLQIRDRLLLGEGPGQEGVVS